MSKPVVVVLVDVPTPSISQIQPPPTIEGNPSCAGPKLGWAGRLSYHAIACPAFQGIIEHPPVRMNWLEAQ